MSKRLPAGATQDQVIEGLRAAGRNSEADLLSGMHLTPGIGIDLQALSRILLVVLALYMLSSIFGWLQAYVLNAVVQRTMYSLREDVEAQDQPAAAWLLRQDAARGTAQPRHQRHRQRLPKPATDLQPDGDLAAHRGRGGHHDADRLAAADGDRGGDDPADHPHHGRRRQALAEALRRPVETHRRAERGHRGELHRALAGEGLRPPAGGQDRVRRQERRAVPRELRRPVRLRHHPALDDVRREPHLRRHRRGRRHAGGRRLDAAGRRAGVPAVLPPVHPAAGAAGQHGEPDPVGRRVRRARLRAPRGRRADPRTATRRRARRPPTASWSSRTSASATPRTSR